MCGICGFVGLEDANLLKDMAKVIEHRGKNHVKFLSRDVGLFGYNSLQQVLHNEKQTVFAFCDGVIYNHKKLKEDLENKGHRFYSNSDLETLVHLYEEFDECFPEKIHGVFAFALWDEQKKKLLLGRDRIGVRPLYYTIIEDKFFFASEIKAILQYNIRRTVDKTALQYYLTFRYVPGPLTMFKGIKKLQPGFVLSYDNDIVLKKYWDFIYSIEEKPMNYFIEKAKRLIEESVRVRLGVKTPTVFLSGGLDSSYLTAVLNKLCGKVKTFSVSFKDNRFDEIKYADIVAQHLETEHKKFFIGSDVIKFLPQIIYRFDEPVADPAAIPTYLLAKNSDSEIIFGGEGGDELFGGYGHYKIMLTTRKFRYLPNQLVVRLVKRSPKSLLDKFFMYTSALGERGINRFSQHLNSLNDKARAYLSIVSIFDEEERRQLLLNPGEVDIAKNLNKKYFTGNDLINELSYLELKVQMPDNLTMKWDKMLTSFSIKPELPYIDHKLIEFSATIPPQYKIKGWTEKFIFRKIASSLLPSEIIKRKKQRFFVPIDAWFEDELLEIIKQIFSKENVNKLGFFLNTVT